jgi:RNA polymerase sigma-70 factor (ECF subfamily)
MQEEQLVRLSLKKDRKAMEELYNRFSPKMRAICFRYTRSVFEVDDILQEAFIKVFTKLDTYSGQGSLEGWIRRVVVNTAINYYHSNQNFNLHVPYEDVREESFEAVEIAEKVSVDELYDAINELPAGYKIIFNMFAIDGYSHKEIADSLNITESTSRSQYTRARKHLINLLEKKNYVGKVG